MTRSRIVFFMVFLIIHGELFSQDKSIVDLFKSNSRKANKLFEHKEFSRSRKYYLKLYKKDSLNHLTKLRLAECNRFLNNTEEAEVWYRKVINISSVIEPKHELHYAEVLLSNGKPDESKFWFEKYNKDNKEDKRSKVMAVPVITIKKLLRDSMAYTLSPVVFNSLDADFSSVYYHKGIVFLSSRKHQSVVRNVSAVDNTLFLNLFYVKFVGDTSFSKPLKFHSDLNFSLHDGPVTFFDKEKKVIFSKNQKAIEKDEPKKLGLYSGELNRRGNQWKKMQELPFSCKEYNVSHPFFYESSNTLFFVSDMPGGFGGSDVYSCSYNGGEWSKPINLGALINSDKNETFPFVSNDSILYFSSNGHRGLGGLDVFRSDLRKPSSPVINLGYPVNSSKDDFAFVLDDACSEGFVSSNRKNGGLDDDIYSVRINKTRLELLVIDKLKSTVIKNAKVVLINQETNEKEKIINNNSKGIYVFDIVPGRKYMVEVNVNGYKSETIEVSANRPDQKIVKVKGVMEKYNKIYVKGKVLLNGDGAGVCTIKVYDPTADSVDVLLSNNKGEFQCQINTDTVNILVAEGQKMMGIYLIKPEKRKRKSSSIQFHEIPLGTLDSVIVKGVLKRNAAFAPDSSARFILRNDLTNKELFFTVNVKGEFAFKLWDSCTYTVFQLNNNKRSVLKKFEPLKTRFIELVESNN